MIRISGPHALAIGAKHISPWPLEARKNTLCRIRENGRWLDEAVVCSYPAPGSFTGEDTVEIFAHGGTIVPSSIMAALLASGARQALAGEFTRRAVLNGKLDLIRAEAVGDLISASSSAMQKVAVDQLDGALTRELESIRSAFLDLEAAIAYSIDFPEEDDGPIPREQQLAQARNLQLRLERLLATTHRGEIIRGGALVVIAGPSNAGKSSLFNALLGKQRAIVTDMPGTTRDALEALIEAGDWPLRLVDTAGLRETDELIESLGIETTRRYLSGADVVLACADSLERLDGTVESLRRLSPASVIGVLTKSDACPPAPEGAISGDTVRVSAHRLEGLSRLLEAISSELSRRHGPLEAEAPLLTRARHRAAIQTALAELKHFMDAWDEPGMPPIVAAVHVRAAVTTLEELLGVIGLEDVLDRLFSSFCIGK